MNLYIIAVMIVIAIFLSVVVPSSKLNTEAGVAIDYVPKTMTVTDYFSSPFDSLIGNSDGETIKASNTGSPSGAINLVLLVLAIGGFVGICTRVGLFDSLIGAITTSGLSLNKITVLLTLYFVVCATTFGLYESAVCYLPITIKLYKQYNVPSGYPIKVLLLSVSIGYIASPINPFATLIADQIAGNTANLFVMRSVLLIVLTVVLIVYLLFGLRKYEVIPISGDKQIASEDKLKLINVLLFMFPYVYMTIGFVPNFIFDTSMSMVTMAFIGSGFVIGLVGKLSMTKCIDYFIDGVNSFMVMAVSITLARTVYIILFNSQVIDTIIFNIVEVISPFSAVLIIIIIAVLFLVIGYIIPSPSALAMITLPIIAPALELVGISIASTVTLFLLIHGLSKMYTLTSPLVIASLNEAEVPYQDYLYSIRPYVAFTLILGFALVLAIA